MKAVVIARKDELKVKDIEVPQIGEDEVLIKHKVSGICHSDYLPLVIGDYITPFEYPVIPGHEWAGEIVEVGKKVEAFKVGDRVVGECVMGCGKCELCKSGNYTNCPNGIHFGFSMHGADSEYFKAVPRWLHKLPDGVSLETGALVEPFTVAYYGVDINGGTDPGETVVITGGGCIGLCSLAVAKGKGARVILIEPMPNRAAVAKDLGADFIVDPLKEDPVKRVLDLTNGKGGDLVIEASGHVAAIKSVLDYARFNGRISMVGINIGEKLPLIFGDIQLKGLTVRGVTGSPYVWDKALRFLDFAKIDLTVLQTHRFSLEEGEAAFKLASQTDKCIKVAFVSN